MAITQTFQTLGIFLRLRLQGSPDRHGVSSGLLGVEGGLILEGEEMPASRFVLRSSGALRLARSEFCLKKLDFESSWWGTDTVRWMFLVMINVEWLGWTGGLVPCQGQETRRQEKHNCFPSNFVPTQYLHKGSPWMVDLQNTIL